MKEQVLKFLGDLPKSGSDQFNKALELLRKSKGHDAGKVRYYNNLGFSSERLDGLLYDLKKQYAVSDLEVSKAGRVAKESKELKLYVIGKDKIVSAALTRLKNIDGIMAMELPDALNLYSELENNLNKIKEEDIPEDLVDSLSLLGSVLAQCKGAAANEEYKDLKTVKELGLAYSELIGKQSRQGLKNVESSEDAEKQLESVKTDLHKEIEEKLSESRDIVSEDGEVIIAKMDYSSEEKKEVVSPISENQTEPSSEDKTDEAAAESSDQETPKEVSAFLKKLDGFDVDAEVYNSIKSFAAEVSKELEIEPKDQKAVTLKAFIVDAKKKHFPA